MKIEILIEKYLKEGKIKKFEIHPTIMGNALKQDLDIKKIEVVIIPRGFLDKGSIFLSEKQAKKLGRKIGKGTSLISIKNDKVIFEINPNIFNPNKFEKFYDDMDEYDGGFVDIEIRTFIYVSDDGGKQISRLDKSDFEKVSLKFTG